MPRVSSKIVQIAIACGAAALLAVAVVGMLLSAPEPTDRVAELSERISCPECESVAITDSPSETANEMQAIIAEQVEAGRSDEEIIDHFRARYGDWVVFDPEPQGAMLPLWLAPAGAAVLGGIALVALRARREATPGGELDAGRRERLERELDRVRGARGAEHDDEEAP